LTYSQHGKEIAMSLIDDRRVRYLYEAVTAGSIRAAADKMDMNASVISRQVAQLESALAMTLLERHGRGVKPTDAGAIVIDYYRQHASQQEDLLSKLQEIRALGRGHIDLILGEGFVGDLMGPPLQTFWQQHPGLSIAMRLASTNEVMRAVTQDEAHLGLVYNAPMMSGIRSRLSIRQPMCAVTLPHHPLTRMGRQPLLKHVLAYPFALMQAAYGTRQIVELSAQMDRLALTPKLMTDSISVIKLFVRNQLGVSLLPAFSITQEMQMGELVATPIDNPILAQAQAHIVTRLGRQLSPAANQLLLSLMSSMQAFRSKSIQAQE
jgi:DNA-binding transcriptional LysR family regulator